MQKAAIVILNYNGEKTLNQFLPSVVQHSNFSIYVADNASSDLSVELLKKKFPSVHLLLMEKNFGFAEGYNRALEMLKSKFSYYILLNSDVAVTPNWDIELLQFLEVDPFLAGIQPKILSYSKPEFFEHAGAAGGFIDLLGYPYCRGRLFNSLEKDYSQYDDEVLVDWVSGACMAVRSALYHQTKGFDPTYFAHMEEIDWCWRLRRMGYQFKYTGKVTVFHQGASTLSKSNPQKTFLNFRNNLFTLKKNLPRFNWMWVYGVRLVLDALAALSFFIRGDADHAGKVFKAHWEFLRDDKKIHSPTNSSKSNGKIKFLIWTYYIRRNKQYPGP
jgi:GT2 family glycosyltransferase